MPAVSQSQREALNAKFGHAWVKAHGFDNKGPLPAHVKPKKHSQKRHKMLSNFVKKNSHGR
jgi:hypothetical protein